MDLTPSKALTPADAVAAILWTHDGRYLLQHRDAVSTIFYPDHWGCFGGAMEMGEAPLDALHRELEEELAVDFRDHEATLFSRFQFSVEPAGISALDRFYYQIRIEADLVQSMKLGEGKGMQLVPGRDAVNALRLVPYDAFALWLHCFRDKVTPAQRSA